MMRVLEVGFGTGLTGDGIESRLYPEDPCLILYLLCVEELAWVSQSRV